MIEEDWKDTIKLFEPNVVRLSEAEQVLVETSGEGEAELHLKLSNPCIVIRNVDKNPIKIFKNKNCADQIVFEKKEEKWHLHIFEMKKTINPSKWEMIKKQFSGAFLHALAYAGVLGIDFSMENICVYTVYRRVKAVDKTNPVKLHPGLEREVRKGLLEWENEKVDLTYIRTYFVRHKKILLDEESGKGEWSL
ncbi:MAG: hypothetical protein IJ733_16050 [Lachnospiraceae bacterium]|nr:hypothetical protein [Lachnospiraceae bacterium]